MVINPTLKFERKTRSLPWEWSPVRASSCTPQPWLKILDQGASDSSVRTGTWFNFQRHGLLPRAVVRDPARDPAEPAGRAAFLPSGFNIIKSIFSSSMTLQANKFAMSIERYVGFSQFRQKWSHFEGRQAGQKWHHPRNRTISINTVRKCLSVAKILSLEQCRSQY